VFSVLWLFFWIILAVTIHELSKALNVCEYRHCKWAYEKPVTTSKAVSLHVRIAVQCLQNAGLCGNNSTVCFEKNDNMKNMER